MGANHLVMCDLQRELANLYLENSELYPHYRSFARASPDGEHLPNRYIVAQFIAALEMRLREPHDLTAHALIMNRLEYWHTVEELYQTHNALGKRIPAE